MDIQHLELFGFFNVMVFTLLMLDLFVFHRKSHVVSVREALIWTAFWIVLSLGLYVLIYFYYGDWVALEPGRTSQDAAHEFLAAYLIEKSLSVDNLFIFLIIFSRFRLPTAYQHKLLFWGIMGAIIMRVAFIFAGVELIHRFEWLMYIFGGFLIYTGFKLLKESEPEIDLEKNPFLQLARRIMPLTTEYSGGRFFARYNGVRHATPMFLVLILVESTDLLFALDSIPAVLGMSNDFLIIYSSNIMAILGLRSLYFALAGIMRYFRYLNIGLSVILIFIGLKMILAMDFLIERGFGYKIDTHYSLLVVGSILAVAILASVLNPLKKDEEGSLLPEPLPEQDPDAEPLPKPSESAQVKN
ncbi:MAG: TerC family protein [Sphingobacteriia bacterium]